MNEEDLYLKGKMDAMSALNKYFEDEVQINAQKFAIEYLKISVEDAIECKVPQIINALSERSEGK